MVSEDNKRIAKNTFLLYIRLFFSMIIGLYTSRVVLATLGVEDYGIYGVVGGVVGMMGFLNSAMSGATSRFLTYELGHGDKGRLKRTFSSAMIVHFIIAFVVFLLAETIGLWYVLNKLVIPDGRETAAMIVYQFSVLSSILSITQVPYNSSIIAHERMGVYAYVEILNVTLKLLIVYLLVICDFDKLILYSALYFVASLIVMMTYRVYCLYHFSECKFHWIWKREYLKPLISFSGWNLFGNFGYIVGNQASNLIVNSFFGVVMNAASSVALTVCGVVTQFSSNAMIAFRPPITKSYAQCDIFKMQKLTILALKIILFLYTLVAIPVFLECDYILSLWLVSVPNLAPLFCKILIVSIFFETMCQVIIIDIHASGNVKLVSALSGTLFSIAPIIVFILYELGFPAESSFIVFAINNAFRLIFCVIIAKHYIPQIQSRKYFQTLTFIVLVSLFTIVIVHFIQPFVESSFIRFVVTVIVSIFVQGVLFLFVLFSSIQRKVALNIISSRLLKFKI